MSRNGKVDVAVVGGGAVGVTAALELARRGASVRLLERGPELAWGCSSGNAGIVGPGHVVPLAEPAAVRDGMRWMLRPDSPFFIRPRPRVLPWLARFLAAAHPRRAERNRRILQALAERSAAMHADLAESGLEAGYRRAGLVNAYRSADALASANGNGAVPPAELTSALAPDLAGVVFDPAEAHCDPYRFVDAMGERARDAGVDIQTGVEVLGLRRQGSRIASLWTTAGDVEAGEIVLAAGVWTAELARELGVRLPIEGGKGYHVDLEAHPDDPEVPVWLHENRVVITPLDGRLRLAGTLELSGTDQGVDPRRVKAIVDAARRAMPRLASRRTLEVWRGLRPCTPDGLPIIGRSERVDNAVFATGHGMWGLQLAPLTGELVAGVAAGDAPEQDVAPLRPDRFA